jgi:transposase
MEAKFADVPDRLWKLVAPLLPAAGARPRGGRPRIPDRRILAGIVYRLRTGCQWKALPREFAAGSTCHDRFRQWCLAGVFQRIFAALLRFYDGRRKVNWTWASLDSAMVKAPKVLDAFESLAVASAQELAAARELLDRIVAMLTVLLRG